MLEVQRYMEPKETFTYFEQTGHLGDYVHVGSMNTLFKSTKAASEYYSKHNEHMRALRKIQGVYSSDWDPVTRLRYVVRPYAGELLNVDPFDMEDAPRYNITRNTEGEIVSISCQYSSLV